MPEIMIGMTPVLAKVTDWGALVVPIAVPPKLRTEGETDPVTGLTTSSPSHTAALKVNGKGLCGSSLEEPAAAAHS